MKKHFVFFMIFIIAGCEAKNWSYFYPYCNINPDKFHKNLPVDYDDCLNQFDTILKKEAINYFKNRDSSVASIEIAQGIGGLFINFWNLEYYRPKYYNINNGVTFSWKDSEKPKVLDKFIKDSITDPEAMVRILFICYHKKLNNKKYNWETEIQRFRKYWIPATYGEGWVSTRMIQIENEILVNYHFSQLEINDTVDILYNRAPHLLSKTPDWYYLTGIIKYKLPDEKAINVKPVRLRLCLSRIYENRLCLKAAKCLIY